MNLRRIVSLVLVVLMIIGVSVGCSTDKKAVDSNESGPSPTTKNETKKIGVAIADFSDQFQVYLMEGMKDAAANLDGIEVVYVDAKYDANKQMAQVENFIAQEMDAIVLMAVDTEASVPMVKAIKDAGIPLISVNRKLQNQELAVSYVGSDSYISGRLEMEAVGEAMGGQGNIAILMGSFGHEPAILRTQGYKDVIAEKYPDIKVVAEETGDWYRDKGMEIAENWLQSNLVINAIVANNDEMALGAIKAAEDAGVRDKLIIAGIDATPEALEYLKAGRLDFTVFQDAKGQGGGSIEVAAKVAKGETVDELYDIPYVLVRPEDVDKYLK
ncbi:MAG: rhizopine-binding protein [Firmicutes bacterium HGW-Firmicutes-7]|nr:MAG: rhizopine-binding protein [Firmicutes bacterium HGW-Firmicutes-7]